jgi:hypothetical protein
LIVGAVLAHALLALQSYRRADVREESPPPFGMHAAPYWLNARYYQPEALPLLKRATMLSRVLIVGASVIFVLGMARAFSGF